MHPVKVGLEVMKEALNVRCVKHGCITHVYLFPAMIFCSFANKTLCFSVEDVLVAVSTIHVLGGFC